MGYPIRLGYPVHCVAYSLSLAKSCGGRLVWMIETNIPLSVDSQNVTNLSVVIYFVIHLSVKIFNC